MSVGMEKNNFLATALTFDVAESCCRLEKSFEMLSKYVGARKAHKCISEMLSEVQRNIDNALSEQILSDLLKSKN